MTERISVLRLSVPQTEKGVYSYTEYRRLSCCAKLTNKSNIFSKIGIGARDVKFTIRHNGYLQIHDRLLWRNNNCFITSITPLDRLYDEVDCAIAEVKMCKLYSQGEAAGPTFPGILTERYVNYSEPSDPYSVNDECFVLVSPKQIVMPPGALCEVSGVKYHIRTAHLLDPYKNEYEILRQSDL